MYLFKVNNKNTRPTPKTSFWCLYCWLNTFHNFFYFFMLLTQVNARCGWLSLWPFSCISYIYLRVQQKQLSSHTLIGGTGGGEAITRYIWFYFMAFISLRWGATTWEMWFQFTISSIDDSTISLLTYASSKLLKTGEVLWNSRTSISMPSKGRKKKPHSEVDSIFFSQMLLKLRFKRKI